MKPTFITSCSSNVYSAIFVLHLVGIGTKPTITSDPETAHEWELWQDVWGSRFISGILAKDCNREVELRYFADSQSSDRKLKIILVGKTRAHDEDSAITTAKLLYDDIEASININADNYVFKQVNNETEIRNLMEPFAIDHLVELKRSGVSFYDSDKPGFRGRKDALNQSFMVPYQISNKKGDSRFLCQLFEESNHSLMLCIKLAHTSVILPPADNLKIDEDFKLISPEVCAPMILSLTSLASQKEHLCSMRIIIAASGDLPGSIVRMIGSDLFSDDLRAWEAIGIPLHNLNGSPSMLDLSASEQPLTDLSRVYTREEARSIFRLPLPACDHLPGLQKIYAYLPKNISKEGTVLGSKTTFKGTFDIRLTELDKNKHVYVLGQTGTGKSTLLHSMALSDIRAGRGICVIDPHGDLLEKIIVKIPKSRINDVILFDPTDSEYPIGLNLLDASNEREKFFLANELVLILRKLYDPNSQGIVGPQFEQAVRNAALTSMSLPDGGTVLEITKLLGDQDYALSKIKYVKDELVLNFWNDIWFKKSPFHFSEILGYITSKFDGISSDLMMRRIIGQSSNVLNLRRIMEDGNILLVNLSKGMIGELNSALLGAILVAKLFTAVLGRQNIPANARKPFTLYLDEFHNFTTETIQSMLSESRKYRLALVLAHQNLQQIPPEYLQTILGNVGNIVFFRPGPPDIGTIENYVKPYLSVRDLIDMSNWTAVGRILINGAPSRPFVFNVTQDQGEKDYNTCDYIRRRMHRVFGQSKADIDKEICKRLRK